MIVHHEMTLSAGATSVPEPQSPRRAGRPSSSGAGEPPSKNSAAREKALRISLHAAICAPSGV
jgi:hypothetical protein